METSSVQTGRKIRMLLCALAGATLTASGPAAANDAHVRLRDIHAELVNINTAPSGGSTTEEAANAMAKRLLDAGFPGSDVLVIGPSPERSALVARYRSEHPAHRPVLMMAHLDVVEALPDDWSFDPFEHREQDGYFYGRGSIDNKAGAAVLVSNLIRLREEGFRPNRDLIVYLSADEETDGMSTTWILANHRELIDAEFALNSDSGYVQMTRSEASGFMVQTAEKMYGDYEIEIRNPGGHSSLPRQDNAINQLARALLDIVDYRFPVDLNETTRYFFEQYLDEADEEERPLVAALAEGRLDDPALAALPGFPYLNAQARTTCVATTLTGGHAPNALPQTARANVNCRILPQADPDAVHALLAELVEPFDATLARIWHPMRSPPSAVEPTLFYAIEEVAASMWGDIPVTPVMEAGATDAAYMRNAGIPTYGVSGLEADEGDDRSHGRDERVGVQALYRSGEFWYRLTRKLAAER